MSRGSLTPLQLRILRVLGGPHTPWVLTGGAALVVSNNHRTTRDLDFFCRGIEQISAVAAESEQRLRADGLDVATIQTAPAFKRLRVSDGSEATIVDLVAEPAPPIAEPKLIELGEFQLRVDTDHEILVSKLCALLSRQEPRDLFDSALLLRTGGDLHRAIADAPRKDAGFSPLLLAWNIRGLDLPRWCEATGLNNEECSRLESFREELISILTR